MKGSVMRLRYWTVALLLLVLVNAGGAYAWTRLLPGIPLFPSSAKTQQATEKPGGEAPVLPVIGSAVPARGTVESLYWLFEPPKKWIRQSTDPAVLGSAIDVTCPEESVAPVVAKSGSFALPGYRAGLVVQVSAYSAGYGARALTEAMNQARSCTSGEPVLSERIANGSIEVVDDGIVDGGGPSGRTIWFRMGDVVGMVAERGAYLDLHEIAKDWADQWPSILTPEVCPNPDDGTVEGARNPLSENWEGWVKTDTVALDPQNQAIADLVGHVLVQTREDAAVTSPVSRVPVVIPPEYIQSEDLEPSALLDSTTPFAATVTWETDPAPEPGVPVELNPAPGNPLPVPTEAGPTLIVKSLPVYPADLNVQLGAAPPVPGPPPVFPTAPESVTVTSHTPDPVGPGCGWAFTGMTAPAFKADEEYDAAVAKTTQSTAAFIQEQADYWQQRWAYAVAYQPYAAQAVAYNQWVTTATRAITIAWWRDYDTKLAEFEAAMNQYQVDYSQWIMDNAACDNQVIQPTPTPTPTPDPTLSPDPTPTPTPTPDPTPTATPTKPGNGNGNGPKPLVALVCPPVAPVLPTAPTEPTLPRLY